MVMKLELLKFLLKSKKNIKRVERFKGFYLISLLCLYSCGGGEEEVRVRDVMDLATETNIEGTDGSDILNYEKNKESLVVNSLDGNDRIRTGDGADIVRGGLAVDEIETGGGDDIILLVGKTGVGQYSQEDVEEVLSLVLSAEGDEDSLNGRLQSEVSGGEVIDGGEGEDTLVIYGEVDLVGVELRGIENVRVYSVLSLTKEQVESFRLIKGDGSSQIKIQSLEGEAIEIELDMLDLEVSGLRELELGRGVKLIVSSERGVNLLNSFGVIRGEGEVIFRDGVDGEGDVVSALSLAQGAEGMCLYAREFVEGEQVSIEGVKAGVGINIFVGQIVDEVFILKEGEDLVDVGDFDLTGLLISGESMGFSIVDGELRVGKVKNYEEDARHYILRLDSENYSYCVKVLLVDKDDIAMITGDLEGEVREDSERVATGTLMINDEDGESQESFFTKEGIRGECGVLSITAEGEWTYILNNQDLRVQGLRVEESLVDEIKVESVGGTSEIIRITINGEEEEEANKYIDNFLLLGSGAVGSKLSLELVDLEALTLGNFTYQWLRNGLEIDGETQSTYIVKNGDLGEVISVRISLGELRFNTEEILIFKSSSTFAGGLIDIQGDSVEGSDLIVEIGKISVDDGSGTFEELGEEDFDYEYQWYRGGEPLVGETEKEYQVSSEDIEMILIVEVVLTHRASGKKLIRKKESSIIEDINADLEGEIGILGEARQGNIVLVDFMELFDKNWLNFNSFSCQWYRDRKAIEGATDCSYVLGQLDVNTTISVKVMIEDEQGNTELKEAQLDSVVRDADDLHTGRVKIESESIFPGDEISASIAMLEDIDGIKVDSYEYQWYRDGERINEATEATLLVLDDWSGELISVEVMFEDELGNINISRSVGREVYESTSLRIRTELLYAEENYTGKVGMVEVSYEKVDPILRFSIGDTRFNVDERTGEVFLNFEQDYEATESNMLFMMTVSDGEILSIREVELEIRDVNEVPKFVETQDLVFTIEENTVNTALSSMWEVLAIDEDEDDLISYSINDITNFGISEAGTLYLIAEQNYEFEPSLMVTVTATDVEGLINTKSVTVNISNTNDNPIFGNNALSFSIEENATNTILDSMWEVLAVDEDGDDLSYNVSDTENFGINEAGVLYLKIAQDYEVVQNLTVTVTADDGIGELATKLVTINIDDVSDNVPEMIETDYRVEEGVSTVQILARDDDGSVENSSLGL